MAKYKRKALTVEAEQFFPDKKPWPKNVIQKQDGYYLDTHGPYRVWEGDWIVTKKSGRQEVYSPKDFKELFEKAIRHPWADANPFTLLLGGD